MAVRTRCPECHRSYTLADDSQGKKVRCKQCQHVFVVQDQSSATPDEHSEDSREAEDTPRRAVTTGRRSPSASSRAGRDEPESEDRPRNTRIRRRPRDDDRDEPRRAKGRGPRTGLLIGLVAGGVALLLGTLGGGVMLYRSFGRASARRAAAITQPTQPGVPNPGATPSWNVQVDAGAPLREPANPKGIVPLGPAQRLLYPTRPSPFVAIGTNATESDVRQVWDLQAMRKVGSVAGKLDWSSPDDWRAPPVLSPDGKYLAGRSAKTQPTVIEVVFADNGRPAQKLTLDPGASDVHFMDFAGPDELVVVRSTGQNQVLELWSLTTGQILKRIDGHQFAPIPRTMAVSPTGRYLVSIHTNLTWYDLAQGSASNQIVAHLPQGTWRFKALAFSPDGAELAYMSDNGTRYRVLVFDVATGKQVRAVDLPENVSTLTRTWTNYRAPALEWLPDRSGWLLYGSFLIDNPSGGVVYTLPSDFEVTFPTQPRLLSKNHLAVVTGPGAARQLQILTLPQEQLDQAVRAVRSGQNPGTVVMAGAKGADTSTARQVPSAGGAVAWKVEPDALPVQKLTMQPIALPVQGTAVDRVVFAEPARQAAVLSQTTQGAAAGQCRFRADRYDLATGAALGGMELFATAAPKVGGPGLTADLAPDGNFLAVVEPGSSRRVDVWSLADNKQVAGWQPHDQEKGTITWVGFVSSRRLLTASSAGQLVLWDLPSCRAVYVAGGFQGALTLSPGRKYLAGFNAGGVELLEAASGERRGRLTSAAWGNVASGNALAFRVDGNALAGLFDTASGPKLVCWDLKNGRPIAEAPALRSMGALHWCGDKHLLLESYLVDLNLKATVWDYALPGPGKHATRTPDGRHWFAGSLGGAGAATLTAQTLPDVEAQQLVSFLQQPTTRIPLRPGMSVSLQVDVTGSGGKVDEVRRMLKSNVEQHLTRSGLKVANGAPVSLRVQLTEQATGQTRRFAAVSDTRQAFTVAVKQLTCQATLSGPEGVLWQNRQAIQTPEARVVETDNIQQYFDQQLWQGAATWASGVCHSPTFLILEAGRFEALPKHSRLSGDR